MTSSLRELCVRRDTVWISRPSASSARARWATASPRCSRRRASRCGSSTSRSRCSIARARRSRRASRSSSRRASCAAARSRRGARPAVDRDRRSTSSADADYVVEAIVENADAKRALFASLDAIARPDVDPRVEHLVDLDHRCSARRRSGPDSVLGMHFMNPVPLMTLVELIRGQATSDESMRDRRRSCARRSARRAVEAADYPGFIANRILMPMINEAIFAVMEGVGTPEAIDAVMKLGMNHPMGPLTLADFIGLDVCLAILERAARRPRRSEVPPVSRCSGGWSRRDISGGSRAGAFTRTRSHSADDATRRRASASSRQRPPCRFDRRWWPSVDRVAALGPPERRPMPEMNQSSAERPERLDAARRRRDRRRASRAAGASAYAAAHIAARRATRPAGDLPCQRRRDGDNDHERRSRRGCASTVRWSRRTADRGRAARRAPTHASVSARPAVRRAAADAARRGPGRSARQATASPARAWPIGLGIEASHHGRFCSSRPDGGESRLIS